MVLLYPQLILRVMYIKTLLKSLLIQCSSVKVGGVSDDDAPPEASLEGLKTVAGANILSLTSLGFNGEIPLFLKPLRILTGVIECAQVLPTSDAITSDVMTLPGFSIMYFRQALEYPDLNDLNTPISKGCSMWDV